jgi:hypothetical protein
MGPRYNGHETVVRGHLRGPALLVHRTALLDPRHPKHKRQLRHRRQKGRVVPGAVPARRCSHLVLLEQEGRGARRAIAGAVQGRAGDDPLDELVDELEREDNGADAGEPLEAHVVLQVHPPKRNADGHAQHESAPQPQAGSGPQLRHWAARQPAGANGAQEQRSTSDCHQSGTVQLYITCRIPQDVVTVNCGLCFMASPPHALPSPPARRSPEGDDIGIAGPAWQLPPGAGGLRMEPRGLNKLGGPGPVVEPIGDPQLIANKAIHHLGNTGHRSETVQQKATHLGFGCFRRTRSLHHQGRRRKVLRC